MSEMIAIRIPALGHFFSGLCFGLYQLAQLIEALLVDGQEAQAHSGRAAFSLGARPDDGGLGFDRRVAAESNARPRALGERSRRAKEQTSFAQVANARVHGDVLSFT